jgi:hypothetical protein
MRLWLTVFFLCSTTLLFSQDKLEKESRIRSEEVPLQAQQWVEEAFGRGHRVKWYYERTSGKESYEAKFRWKRQRYSVEFSLEGALEDVEMRRKFKSIPPALQKSLKEIEGFQLQRLQEQWSGPSVDVMEAIRTGDASAIQVQYEVEFMGKINEEKALWEGTFSQEGALLDYRHIILRPVDNLNY